MMFFNAVSLVKRLYTSEARAPPFPAGKIPVPAFQCGVSTPDGAVIGHAKAMCQKFDCRRKILISAGFGIGISVSRECLLFAWERLFAWTK
jgi:hypothetical protein